MCNDFHSSSKNFIKMIDSMLGKILKKSFFFFFNLIHSQTIVLFKSCGHNVSKDSLVIAFLVSGAVKIKHGTLCIFLYFHRHLKFYCLIVIFQETVVPFFNILLQCYIFSEYEEKYTV